jgi:hypothetical protein
MLLPQLYDELARAAARPHALRRVGGRTTRAIAAALVTLLVAAPVAHAQLSVNPEHAPIVETWGSA